MQSFTLEANTLSAIQRLTADPAAFVRQAVAEKLACDALADGLPLEGLNLDDLPDLDLSEIPAFNLDPDGFTLDGQP